MPQLSSSHSVVSTGGSWVDPDHRTISSFLTHESLFPNSSLPCASSFSFQISATTVPIDLYFSKSSFQIVNPCQSFVDLVTASAPARLLPQRGDEDKDGSILGHNAARTRRTAKWTPSSRSSWPTSSALHRPRLTAAGRCWRRVGALPRPSPTPATPRLCGALEWCGPGRATWRRVGVERAPS